MATPSRDRATVICQQQGRILLVRKTEAKWSLPGGKLEADEGPLEAALRELYEETGLAGCELDFLASEQVARRVHHVFRTHLAPGQQAVPDNEIADCRWFGPDEITSHEIKRTIRELLRMHLGCADGSQLPRRESA